MFFIVFRKALQSQIKLAAAHHDDLIYIFSLSYQFPTIEPSDSNPDSRLVDQMTALFYNFARYGDPNPKGDTPELGHISWPVMKANFRKYLRVADKLTIEENMKENRMKVWDELYPIKY